MARRAGVIRSLREGGHRDGGGTLTRRALVLAALVAALALSSSTGRAQDLDGKPAPNFSLKDMNGKTVSLSDYRGKVVLLDFWATWCGPCKESLPFMETLRDKYRRHGFEVIGLHVDDRRPPPDMIQEYIRERKVTYTNVISSWDVDESFQLRGIPTSFVIDREGVVQRTHVGYDPETTPKKIEAHVRAVLGLP